MDVIAVVCPLWAVIDARPAVAIGVFLLGLWMPPGFAVSGHMIPLLMLMVVLAIMAWCLHRQSARVSAGSDLLRRSITIPTGQR